MHRLFPSRRSSVLVTVVFLLATVGVSFAFPDSAWANHPSFRGRRVNFANYGSGARIGTTQPNAGSYASFEMIMTGINLNLANQRHVQVR